MKIIIILIAILVIMMPTLAHGLQEVQAGEGAQDWRRRRDVAQTAPAVPEIAQNIITRIS